MPAGDDPAPRNHPEVAAALGIVRAALRLRSDPTRPIVVACSGGADSVALLGLLARLRESESLKLSVIHVDHGLRPSSGAEAAAVTSLARQLGIESRVVAVDLPVGPGLPARARRERHVAFAAAARAVGADCVALGHTQTDQAETVLLHLTRGAGLAGIAAMPPLQPWPASAGDDTALAWWRPMLSLSRAQTRALAQRLALPFCDDPTNDDRSAPRVSIRHEVLPLLARINPEVERALATAAEHARLADAALRRWVDDELSARVQIASDGVARYRVSDAAALPAAVRRRLIRAVCQRAGIMVDAMSAQTVEGIDSAVCAGGPARSWDLHPSTRVHVGKGLLWAQVAAESPRGVRGRNH